MKHIILFLLLIPALFSSIMFCIFLYQYVSLFQFNESEIINGKLRITETTYHEDEETGTLSIFGKGNIVGTNEYDMSVDLGNWAKKNGQKKEYYWKLLIKNDSLLDVKYIKGYKEVFWKDCENCFEKRKSLRLNRILLTLICPILFFIITYGIKSL